MIYPSKCVYTKKPPPDPDAEPKKKVRIVGCGNKIARGQHEQNFTATVDSTALRAAIRIAALEGWDGFTIDVKCAFLNASLDESEELLYLKPPAAVVKAKLIEPGSLWLIRKALYGLRQAPKAWGVERDRKLQSLQTDGTKLQ